MRYLDRLKAHTAEMSISEEPTKLTEPGFVGFVGASHRGFHNNTPCRRYREGGSFIAKASNDACCLLDHSAMYAARDA